MLKNFLLYQRFKEKARKYTYPVLGGMILLILVVSTVFVQSLRQDTRTLEDRAFQKFTRDWFCLETAANTINLRYTLKYPEAYGIEEAPNTFGTIEMETETASAVIENFENKLKKYSKEKLSVENKITYEILEYYLACRKEDVDFLLYEEPLGLVGGVQTQLPVVLSEFPLDSVKDVEMYLELLTKTEEYFDSLIVFEKKKSEEGLFMSEEMAEQVIQQCDAFVEMGEENYLFSSFRDRIKQIDGLSMEKQSEYIQKNALYVESYVIPAYVKLAAEIHALKKTGKNDRGLCYLPEGTEYYEKEVKEQIGTDKTVEELKKMTQNQILDDLEAMEKVLGIISSSKVASDEESLDLKESAEAFAQIFESGGNIAKNSGEITGSQIFLEEALKAAGDRVMKKQNPVTILKYLEKEIDMAFPKLRQTGVQIKYVPGEMEEHLSPAFYMIPAIDDYKDNVIYVNKSHMGDALTLFTTLAHEGYPGHLYQNVFFADTEPDPIRMSFSFGGYVEGWATYAEMCSYYLTPMSKEQATLLQKNNSILLGLYTLADIGIHYEGWSLLDTISFFSNYGITESAAIERVYQLILGAPGNYLKYYIGYLEFMELKKEWAEEKKDEFSQKEFHEAVLSVGPAPFEIVRKYAQYYVQ